MNKLKAAEMIQKQRRRWRSQDSDLAIARRAERVYFACAFMFFGVAAALSILWQTLLPRIFSSAGFVLGAAIFFWQSRRFTEIRK